MNGEWFSAIGIVAGLALATGGYELRKSYRASADDPSPVGLLSIPILMKAAGEFLLCAGVLLALLLAGILITAR